MPNPSSEPAATVSVCVLRGIPDAPPELQRMSVELTFWSGVLELLVLRIYW